MRICPAAVAKDPLGSDFEQCFRSCGGARASFEKGRLKGSKMSSQGSRNEAKIAPWRPLGGPWVPRSILGYFLVPIWSLLKLS